jgi:hypothetical protein
MSNLLIRGGEFNSGQRRKLGSTHAKSEEPSVRSPGRRIHRCDLTLGRSKATARITSAPLPWRPRRGFPAWRLS